MPSKKPFIIVEPESEPVPFVLSIPHCGVEIPAVIRRKLVPELADSPDDTDWYLDRLYDFAPALGITTIHARYSRWVIDLNRVPDGKPLYNDGRTITELCPTIDFLGDPIYKDPEHLPDEKERKRRIKLYYKPYHSRIDKLIAELKAKFGTVIFWDGHSIRRRVASIRPGPFPDLILGDNRGATASPAVISGAIADLSAGDYGLSHNEPFRGGFLTRSKGDPANGVHALQLEMCKDLYMDESEKEYDEKKAVALKKHLKAVFERLIGLTDELQNSDTL